MLRLTWWRLTTFLFVIGVFAMPIATHAGERSADGAAGRLDLNTALELALDRSPLLQSKSARVDQTTARGISAGLRPNPELRVELEDFAGSGPYHSLDEAQATVVVGQEFELGGKRRARIDAADAATKVALAEYAKTRLDVLAGTTVAFIDTQAAQSLTELSGETLRIAEEIVSAVTTRVRAGSSSRVELTKAEVTLAGARIDNERARRSFAVARHALAATWGDNEARFEQVSARSGDVTPPTTLSSLFNRMTENPDLQRAADEIAHREAEARIEQTRAISDLELGLGYRRYAGSDDNAMVAEMRIPLPLFDRNQGGVLEAQARVSRARVDEKTTESRITGAIRAAHEALTMAYDELLALDTTILPAAETAFSTIREGYREGRFSYLDLLDTQRTLIDAREQRIDALRSYYMAEADILRFTGEGR